jgi:poly(hydroxyalkanoate) depolymerase family esterase
MKWSRELRIARRSIRTAARAASAMAKAQTKLPATLRLAPWSTPDPIQTAAGPFEVSDFGSNPGQLAMFMHVPSAPPAPGAPLIVLLHGCGQAAIPFAREAGWMTLSDRLGVPLVLPEQAGENNHGRCFNWFQPTHVRRGSGEAQSIRQMVASAVQRFGSDPKRTFIAGLSAGGAMTAAMLAAYPDTFAAGAVVAGLPVGAASGMSEALRRMAEAGPSQSPAAWADLARHAAPAGFPGPWPRLSIWHGEADRVVDPDNARLLAGQWSALHGLDSSRVTVEPSDVRREIWGQSKPPAVELWTLPGQPHAWPADAADHIARFWGLGPVAS